MFHDVLSTIMILLLFILLLATVTYFSLVAFLLISQPESLTSVCFFESKCLSGGRSRLDRHLLSLDS
ncbi:hypothetical protein ABN222_04745 [Providencia alcalifaciens]